MTRDTKVLQLILDKVTNLEKKVDKGFKNVSIRFNKTDERIDKLGLQLANLEDDAPTVEEFVELDQYIPLFISSQ